MLKRIIWVVSIIFFTFYFLLSTLCSAYAWPFTRHSDMIGYYAPCWGPNNKIFFIKEVTHGGAMYPYWFNILLFMGGDYLVDKTEVYLCSMNYDGTEKKEIVKIGDTDKGTYWLPMYLDYCPANDLILLSGGVHPARGESINGVYTIKSDGSDKKKISDVGMHASWSPDGKKMVYRMHVKREKRGEDGWLEGYEDYDSLWIMDVDGNNKHKIFSGEKDEWIESPIWSPKGDLIAFVHGFEIWVMKPDGTERRRVIKGMYLFDWLPDGEGIVLNGVYGLNGEEKKLEGGGYYSLNGEWLISLDFVVFNTKTGKKIDPLADIKKKQKHFVYKKPNNIW